MPLSSPLHATHEREGAGFMPYGPAGADQQAVQIVDTFGRYEAEYAAIRKGAGLMDLPQRGLVQVTGSDRLDFLHRMLTHDIAGLRPGQGRRAFLLSRSGRISADVLVLHEPDRTCLEVDLFQAPRLVAQLDQYLFGEDVQVRDRSDQLLQLALHGPEADALLAAASGQAPLALAELDHRTVKLADHPCLAFRYDNTGAPGVHLVLPREGALAVYQALVHTAASQQSPGTGPGRSRPIGWLAYNTARIEAGTPLYNIDFGPDSLPHETGILDRAVSFTKGCYPGQEVVARMQNLGHPKQVLAGLRFDDDRLPIAGSQVLEPPEQPHAGTDPRPAGGGVASTGGQVIGAVTSSCVSPMLGAKAVALAMVKWGMHEPGTHVVVPAEGQMVPATVANLPIL